jgi:UDP-glucose 6-dehydrogenase
VPGFHGINTIISMNTSVFIKLASAAGLAAVVAFINPVAALAFLAGAGVIGITVTDYRARRASFSGLAA